MQRPQSIQMHGDIAKLRSPGVDEDFLRTANLTPEVASDLVRGMLKLRERSPRQA
ncbi:MAG TPA: hypothetical protein VJZ68_04370 [Nitrososphaera sp.]|nr:hypothetical protein [Nitrososphaera sp.]